jgi:hypothetical protein
MPVQETSKFKLIINAKTGKALGLTVPPTLLGCADGVIDQRCVLVLSQSHDLSAMVRILDEADYRQRMDQVMEISTGRGGPPAQGDLHR